ncbi:hypothetical protein WDU94_003161 [Cyamophila willieti]
MDSLIQKTILHTGKEYKEIKDGYKVHFHFVTQLCDSNTVLDDSRKLGKPMQLVLGKKFKLEVWETLVKHMSVGEIAKFVCDKSLVCAYPFVSKTLRDAANTKDNADRPKRHCCGAQMHTGYDDLNELMKTSQDLAFTIELLQVEASSDYEHESWQLTEAEKLASLPKLKDEGNTLYRTGNIQAALEKYRTALGYLEQLMLKEKPNDEEWTKLNQMKIPILLNFSQCKLDEKDYYDVIEHTTTVLSYEPDNIKALYRRGKAHMNVWNTEEAKSDLEKVATLDSTLLGSVNSLLKQLSERVKEKDEETKNRIKGKLF